MDQKTIVIIGCMDHTINRLMRLAKFTKNDKYEKMAYDVLNDLNGMIMEDSDNNRPLEMEEIIKKCNNK